MMATIQWRQIASTVRHACLRASIIAVAACGGSSPNASSSPPGTVATISSGSALAPAAPASIPVIFNAPQSAKAGDIIYLQGENFGDAPEVILQASGSSPDRKLRIVNRLDGWLAAEIPSDAGSALAIRIVNQSRSSATLALNAPVIYGFDSLATVAGGRFRIFGRNLMTATSNPAVKVDGLSAVVDMSMSSPEMLVVKAPSGLIPKPHAAIAVDNGNGLGPADADKGLEILAGTNQATFGGQAGWLEVFAPLLERAGRINCSGQRPVAQTIQALADSLAQNGGGVIQISAGTCVLEQGVSLPNNIVLQGAGQNSTILLYQTDYPFWVENKRVIALRDLTLTNMGSASEGPTLHKSAFLALQNVTMNFGTSRQSFFDGNSNIFVSGCIFNQTGSMNEQSPYLFTDSKGLFFDNNVTRLVMGAAAFERVSDAYIGNSLFRRDASRQNDSGALHMMTIDFASGIAIIDNIFDTSGGPITNRSRNDGEAILTEGGGGVRTENIGIVESASASGLTDSKITLKLGPFSQLPSNYGIAIVSGRGAGQTRHIRAFASSVITVDRPWDIMPDKGSKYATFAWGLENALIKGNVFNQMPRGIWLYQTAIRNVSIIGNRFLESGGIYLRAYQRLDAAMFDPIYNVAIEGNSVRNLSPSWPSYMTSVFVNADARAFGIAMLGIMFRGNDLVAHNPPFTLNSEEYAGNEGYFSMMRVEDYTRYESMTVPRILGTIFQQNICTDCQFSYRIGTGSGGTVISGAKIKGAGNLVDNWKTTISSEQATNTVIE